MDVRQKNLFDLLGAHCFRLFDNAVHVRVGAERHVGSARRAAHRANAARAAARTKLDAVTRDLQATTAQRDDLRHQLDSSQSSLADAKSSLNTEGGQLNTLKTCLNDIKALAEAFNSNDTAAIRSEGATVDRDCLKAEAIL